MQPATLREAKLLFFFLFNWARKEEPGSGRVTICFKQLGGVCRKRTEAQTNTDTPVQTCCISQLARDTSAHPPTPPPPPGRAGRCGGGGGGLDISAETATPVSEPVPDKLSRKWNNGTLEEYAAEMILNKSLGSVYSPFHKCIHLLCWLVSGI